MNQLENRILEISKRHKLSHIGSCISVLPILIDIYKNKQPDDLVILDNAHAHLAHLVVMEQHSLVQNIEVLLEKYGIHCDRKAGCDASGGSLGHGIGISIGLALANKNKTVHCIVSDGSLMEGSNWEAMRIADSLKVKNLKIYCNFNGYTAVGDISSEPLVGKVSDYYSGWVHFFETDNGEGFEGIEGHYKTI